jgi:NADH:ubiquinone oxidoreductase subunit 3 (subunit A)
MVLVLVVVVVVVVLLLVVLVVVLLLGTESSREKSDKPWSSLIKELAKGKACRNWGGRRFEFMLE